MEFSRKLNFADQIQVEVKRRMQQTENNQYICTSYEISEDRLPYMAIKNDHSAPAQAPKNPQRENYLIMRIKG